MNGAVPEKGIIRNIWMLSREYGDLAGAGGVKDVVRQLAEALAADSGVDVRVVIPCYGFISPVKAGFEPVVDVTAPDQNLSFSVDMDYADRKRREICQVWQRSGNGVTLFLIDSARFAEKGGVYTYTETEHRQDSMKLPGGGHYDYFAMNVLLQKAALELMILLEEKPDVIHCHDGHTALIPAYIREWQGYRSYFRDSGCLVTIHNAGIGYHQEVDDLEFAMAITGLPDTFVSRCLLDGKFDPFLAAGEGAVLNTVSENYARELQESDEDSRTGGLGHALLERGVRLEGITNGISPARFNPADKESSGLKAHFDPGDEHDTLAGKRICKEWLLENLVAGNVPETVELYGLPGLSPGVPLFAFIGRLTHQKGVDLLLRALDGLSSLEKGWQLVILGNGMELIEADIIGLTESADLAGRLCFLKGYDTGLAAALYAASDFFIIPSRFEPCGLTDFIAQLYGSVPIVHHIGGLVKVEDGVTGLSYIGDTAEALQEALSRGLEVYKNGPGLRKIRKQAVDNIHKNHTWDIKCEKYRALYLQAKQSRMKGVNR
ncbi:glycogen synthase [Desulfopila sp. IMCC35008]|uniref:glycogen synthase n=1 Tax=Desulfopila sp. IMCC35008 TaxID=2653858 RepID=UPI001F0EBA0A|nr:glycogen/starch synthase [Desulfopila sp. IMCC35008]